MAKFACNNVKNTSTGYMVFELNYGYHSWVSLEKDLDFYLKSKSVEKQFFEL